MALHAVILAGGSGTRFWPLSRAKKPKQFLALVTGKALIAETWARVLPLCGPERIWVVCGADHVEGVREALPQLAPERIVVEPRARNTAPAIGLATLHVRAADADATIAVLPSDHHIANDEAFRAALQQAERTAAAGDLVTLGIQPTRPETGYGYLRKGAERSDGAWHVDAFVEKPDARTAERYLQDTRYSWNAGIFVFRADAMMDALARHLPDASRPLEAIGAALPQGPERTRAATAEAFGQVPSISIDYGVMEPEARSTRRIALVLPGELGWSDVGSFAALPEVRELDARGNAVSGDALALDCDDCVVLSEGDRVVAAVGLRGLCIVDSGDAILVVPRDRAQDVRLVVDALKQKGRTDKL